MTPPRETEYEHKERIQCSMCGLDFVPHYYYLDTIELPTNVCVWCYSRGKLHQRYMKLFEALKEVVKNHGPEGCDCSGCIMFGVATKIIEETE